jgi:hypothetical protein
MKYSGKNPQRYVRSHESPILEPRAVEEFEDDGGEIEDVTWMGLQRHHWIRVWNTRLLV